VVVNSPPHTGINHLSPYHTYQAHPTQSLTSLHTQGGTRVRSSAPAPSSPVQRPGSVNSRHTSKQSLSNGFAHLGGLGYPASPGPSQRSHPAASGQHLQTAPRPESVRSGVSKKVPRTRASQASFVVANPSPNQSPPTPPKSRVGKSPAGGGLTLTAPSPLNRMASSTSLRSTGSYSKYNPAEYEDPAFWNVDGPGPSGAPPPVQRPTSVNSGLSYV